MPKQIVYDVKREAFFHWMVTDDQTEETWMHINGRTHFERMEKS